MAMRQRRFIIIERLVERATGIEPASAAWEAAILPMNYARSGESQRLNYTHSRPVRHLEEDTSSHAQSRHLVRVTVTRRPLRQSQLDTSAPRAPGDFLRPAPARVC